MATNRETQGRLTELAASLEYLTEEELQLLADVRPTTTEAWRKRGLGPAYVLIGNRFLYPKKAVAEYMARQIRDRDQQAHRRDLL